MRRLIDAGSPTEGLATGPLPDRVVAWIAERKRLRALALTVLRLRGARGFDRNLTVVVARVVWDARWEMKE